MQRRQRRQRLIPRWVAHDGTGPELECDDAGERLDLDRGTNVGIGATLPDSALMMTTAASSSAIADHDCCASFAGICLFGAMPSCTDYSMAGDNIAPRKRHINRPKGANIHLLSADRDWRARAGNCSAEDFANRFTIRASVPGVEVSWKVTGIRKDADAGAHRIRVEQ